MQVKGGHWVDYTFSGFFSLSFAVFFVMPFVTETVTEYWYLCQEIKSFQRAHFKNHAPWPHT